MQSKKTDFNATSSLHSVQVPWWPSILRWELKINSKNSSGKYDKKNSHRGQLIFQRGAKQKVPEHLPGSFPLPIMFKKCRDSVKFVLLWLKFKAQGKISPSKFDGKLQVF